MLRVSEEVEKYAGLQNTEIVFGSRDGLGPDRVSFYGKDPANRVIGLGFYRVDAPSGRLIVRFVAHVDRAFWRSQEDPEYAQALIV